MYPVHQHMYPRQTILWDIHISGKILPQQAAVDLHPARGRRGDIHGTAVSTDDIRHLFQLSSGYPLLPDRVERDALHFLMHRSTPGDDMFHVPLAKKRQVNTGAVNTGAGFDSFNLNIIAGMGRTNEP